MIINSKTQLAIGVITLMAVLNAQTPAPNYLVTIPTAGTMQRGEYEVEILMQAGGGILGRLAVGFSDNFMLGMSYGVQKFIGDAQPSLNRLMPEAQLKVRLMDETITMPAIAFGLDTQGRGAFQTMDHVDPSDTTQIERIERYEVKAIGVYIIASKNWEAAGSFGMHLGLSKNFLEADQMDNDINLFFGFDKDLGSSIAIFLEYNSALDDNGYQNQGFNLDAIQELTFGKGRGYLNMGIRWSVAPGLTIEVDFNDMMLNKEGIEYFSRELKVGYNVFF